MFTTEINRGQKEYAFDLVKKTNFGRRGVFDGNQEQQYTGILGQVVMADLIGEQRPNGQGGFDEGIDFVIYGYNVDLKTMGRQGRVYPEYVNNLVYSQVKYKTQVYIFASINKKTSEMTFVGTIAKPNLRFYFLPKGTTRKRKDGTTFDLKTDIFEIPNLALSPIDCQTDICWSIHKVMV